MNFRIYDMLPHGSENAISRRDLMTITNLDARELRSEIADERLKGFPICSNTSTGGYYKPACAEELKICIRHLQSNGIKLLDVAEALEKQILRIEGLHE